MTLDVEELLARMLAVENLHIRYSHVARTASFDTARRLLTLPVFAKLSQVFYRMLAAHEVGHALYTPKIDRIEAAKKLLHLSGWPVDDDPKNISRAASYVNICEDVRIEKLIKLIYPGLRAIFGGGYQEALKMEFFGDLSNIASKSLISRVNLHFKVGAFINVPFAAAELPYVQAIGATQTWDEMMVACRALYEFARDTQNEEFPELDDQPGEDESDPSPEAGAGGVPVPQDESPGEDEPQGANDPADASQDDSEPTDEESNGRQPNESPEDPDADSDDEGDGTEDADDDPEDSDESEESDGASEDSDVAEEQDAETSDGASDSRRPLDDDTQENFDKRLDTHIETKSEEFKYASLPHVVVNRASRDYKVTMADFQEAIVKKKVDLTGKKEWLHGIMRKLEPDVVFLVQQFLMRRRADESRRTRTDTLGDLDMNKLWQYRFQSDIFATAETVAAGKNHGLFMVVDWSGSMGSVMFDVLIQLLVVMMFCRRVQIPFEVSAFLTADHPEGGSFIPTTESVDMNTNTRLYNIFSSRMSHHEFMNMCHMIFGSFVGRSFQPALEILKTNYGTPLGEAMLIASEMSEKFRRRYSLQFVHTVFLTDGDGNSPMTVRVNLLEDPKTRRTYAPKDGQSTLSVLDLMPLIIRHRTGSNMIGFYVGNLTQKMLTDCNMTQEAANAKLMVDGSISLPTTNYNLFLVLNPSMVLPQDSDPGAMMQRRLKSRVFLQQFIQMIA